MQHEELTQTIIGCAYRVYNAMGHGYLELVYKKCMAIELRDCGLRVDVEHPIAVQYRGQPVGDYLADLLVEKAVIVELKAVRALAVAHEVQLVNYLKATGFEVGLLINFGETRVDVKRKLRLLPQSSTTTVS